MNYQEYLKCIQNAATQLAMKGHTKAEHVGVIDLRLSFTSTDVDDEEHTAITMTHSYNATIIPLTNGAWTIDEVRAWETTTEEEE